MMLRIRRRGSSCNKHKINNWFVAVFNVYVFCCCVTGGGMGSKMPIILSKGNSHVMHQNEQRSPHTRLLLLIFYSAAQIDKVQSGQKPTRHCFLFFHWVSLDHTSFDWEYSTLSHGPNRFAPSRQIQKLSPV